MEGTCFSKKQVEGTVIAQGGESMFPHKLSLCTQARFSNTPLF